MTVVETVSTLGGFKVFSSSSTTLATAISEVLNELETHHIPMNQIQFVFTNGGESTPVFTFMAVCKRS